MIIYTILILFSMFCSTIYKKSNDRLTKFIFFFILVFSISIIAGLRGPSVGTDTRGYIENFYFVNSSSLNIFSYEMEPLFILLNKIAYFIYPHHFILLFLCAFITVSLIFIGYVNHSKNFSLSILLFFTSYQFYESLNGMRQYIAIAIVFFSTTYIFNKKPIQFLLFIIIASGFHTTAILFLPLYIVYWLFKKASIFKLIIWVLFAFVTFILLPYILDILEKVLPQYSYYLTTITKGSGGIRNIIVSLLLIFLCILFIFINKKNIEHKTWFYIIVTILYFSTSLYVLKINSNLAQRIGWYFAVFIPMLIPDILNYSTNFKKKMYFQYSIIIAYICLHYYLLYNNSHSVIPYVINGFK